jgi:hypothetical protein
MCVCKRKKKSTNSGAHYAVGVRVVEYSNAVVACLVQSWRPERQGPDVEARVRVEEPVGDSFSVSAHQHWPCRAWDEMVLRDICFRIPSQCRAGRERHESCISQRDRELGVVGCRCDRRGRRGRRGGRHRDATNRTCRCGCGRRSTNHEHEAAGKDSEDGDDEDNVDRVHYTYAHIFIFKAYVIHEQEEQEKQEYK